MEIKEQLREIYTAIVRGPSGRAEELLEANPSVLDYRTPNGSWLHVAARSGKLETVKYLVKVGLDVNAAGGMSGSYPINFASSEGHFDIVKYLLEKGATMDIGAPERNPLFAAINHGHIDIVKLLVAHGIDFDVDYGAKSALSFSEEMGRQEISEYLRSLK